MRILILASLFFTLHANAQDGYAVIKKAEYEIRKGRYEKASRLLNKADTMNYGFCALAWWEARQTILLDRVKIADAHSDTLEAIRLLSDTNTVFSNDQELLKRICLVQKRESVISQLRETILASPRKETEDKYFSVNFSFQENPVYLRDLELLKFLNDLRLNDDSHVREHMTNEFLINYTSHVGDN